MDKPINRDMVSGTRLKGNMVISESVRAFSDDYIWQRGYSTSTANNYRWAINSFIKACGDIELAEVTMDHVIKWRKYMERNTYEQSAMNCNLYKLRSLLRYYQPKTSLKIDPRDIVVPKAKKTIPKFLTIEQLEQLMSVADVREKAIIAVLYASGVRVGELCRLRRKDVLGDCIKVRGKGNIERLAFLNDVAINHLNAYLETTDSQYLFPSKKGGALTTNSVQHLLKGLSNKLPFDVTPHVLRHTFATHIAQAGCGAFHLQKLLGHSHISTTQVYVHLSGEDIRSAYKKYHPSSSVLT